MKKVNNVKLYDIIEIKEMLQNEYSIESVKNFFEEGRMKGKKIDGKWYAEKKAFEDLEQFLLRQKIFFTPPQKIDLTEVILKGRILDIGGGGEGIIGQLNEEKVVAIDPNERELKEAPGDFLKIIMNAKNLKFIDATFDTATSFFTLMYVAVEDHSKIFEEVYRVLKKGGEFVIWDLIIPDPGNNEKEFFGVELEIIIGAKRISTGYAAPWNKEQNLEYYLSLGNEIGFKVLESDINDNAFYIKLQKT